MLWASGSEADKDTARKQKQRLKFVSNILVIKDPKNPANNGKNFLFAYGKKINDMIKDQLVPEFEGETPINPFDFWEGADFALRIRMVDRFPSYDKSKFLAPSPLFGGDDDKLSELYDKEHSLQALLDPSKFKTYAELETKLKQVLGQATGGTARRAEDIPEDDEDELAAFRKQSSGTSAGKEASAPSPKEAAPPQEDDDEDELAMFRNLANRS